MDGDYAKTRRRGIGTDTRQNRNGKNGGSCKAFPDSGTTVHGWNFNIGGRRGPVFGYWGRIQHLLPSARFHLRTAFNLGLDVLTQSPHQLPSVRRGGGWCSWKPSWCMLCVRRFESCPSQRYLTAKEQGFVLKRFPPVVLVRHSTELSLG